MHIFCAMRIGGYIFLQHCSSWWGGHKIFDHQIGGSQKYCWGTFGNLWPPYSKENGDPLMNNQAFHNLFCIFGNPEKSFHTSAEYFDSYNTGCQWTSFSSIMVITEKFMPKCKIFCKKCHVEVEEWLTASIIWRFRRGVKTLLSITKNYRINYKKLCYLIRQFITYLNWPSYIRDVFVMMILFCFCFLLKEKDFNMKSYIDWSFIWLRCSDSRFNIAVILKPLMPII